MPDFRAIGPFENYQCAKGWPSMRHLHIRNGRSSAATIASGDYSGCYSHLSHPQATRPDDPRPGKRVSYQPQHPQPDRKRKYFSQHPHPGTTGSETGGQSQHTFRIRTAGARCGIPAAGAAHRHPLRQWNDREPGRWPTAAGKTLIPNLHGCWYYSAPWMLMISRPNSI